MRQEYIDVYLILKGEKPATLIDLPKFTFFRQDIGKAVIAPAARSLVEFGKSDLVLDFLFEKLSLMVMWGRKDRWRRRRSNFTASPNGC